MTLDHWRQSTLFPALERNLDRAFPEFGFRRGSDGWWIAHLEPAEAGGYGAKEGKLTANGKGFRSFKAGKEWMSWADYLERQGHPFPENLKRLAELAGVDYPEREWTPEQRQEMSEKEAKRKLLRDFMAMAKAKLMGDAGQEARAYLLARGFKLEDLERLDLGLCPTLQEAEADLLPKGHGREPLKRLLGDTRWQGRLVGGIRSPWGELANLWARDLSGQADEGAKYLYLPNEVALLRKGELVPFGLQTGGAENLLLVEGVLDSFHLLVRGFPNVAALGGDGKNLTPEVLERLAKFKVKALTLLLDNDTGGREGIRAALENAAKARAGKRQVPDLWIVDPAGIAPHKDPDAFLKAHKEDHSKLMALVDHRESAALYHARAVLLAGITPESTEAQRKEAASQVVDLANRLRGQGSTVDQFHLFKLTQEATGLPPEVLAAEEKALEEVRLTQAERRQFDDLLVEAHKNQSHPRKAVEALRRGLERFQSIGEPPPAFKVDDLLQAIEGEAEGRPSGWMSLDKPEEEGGLGLRFHPGELALFGARTGHGKTSAMVNLLFNWALKGEEDRVDERLVFYSCEESAGQIFKRLLALMTWRLSNGDGGLSVRQSKEIIRAGIHRNHRDDDGDLIRRAAARLKRWEDRLLVVHRPAWNADAIAAHAKALAERETVGAVLVDYLQRIPAREGSRYDRRDVEVSAISRTLKALAEDLAAPVVTGAQMNRASAGTVSSAEEKEGKVGQKGKKMEDCLAEFRKLRPELHHLREGGAEQEVDLAIGLHNLRADWAGDHETVTRFEVGLLKSRYGSVGKWKQLAFVGRLHLLRDVREGDGIREDRK